MFSYLEAVSTTRTTHIPHRHPHTTQTCPYTSIQDCCANPEPQISSGHCFLCGWVTFTPHLWLTFLWEGGCHSSNRHSQPTNTKWNVFCGPLDRTGLKDMWCWSRITDRSSDDCQLVKMWGAMLQIQSGGHTAGTNAQIQPAPNHNQCWYNILEIMWNLNHLLHCAA